MRKFVSDPVTFTDDSLAGILAAHPAMLRAVSRRGIVRAEAPVREKVAIATGGGYSQPTGAPSTTGTLTARGMLGAARAIGMAGSQPPVRLLYLGFAAAPAAIQSAGKAAPGEKTLIDALVPPSQR
jgi:dihydroxyacetone kinase